MNLHALRIFHHVASHGSVTKAAEALLLSQPAVTAQLRNLERETGLTLLEPKGRGILLTEAGQWLAERAERLFAMESHMERELAAYRDGQRGHIRISSTSLPANALLPLWMASYKRVKPEVDWTVATRNSREAYRDLLLYRSDMALIGGGEEPPEGLERRMLLEDELWFVVPPDHPLAGQEVPLAVMMQEPFIMREEGSSIREKLLAVCRAQGAPLPKAAIQITGLAEIIQAVKAGFGAVYVSALEVWEAWERKEVARVFVPEVMQRNPIALCWRGGEPLPPAVQQFMVWLDGGLTDENPNEGSG